MCADQSLPADAVRLVLDRLVDKSILLEEGRTASGNGVRYRMLDTLREYGARWLADLGQAAAVRLRLRDHYLRLARRGEQAWFGPDQAGWFARMTQEHDNLRAALEMSLGELEDCETALDLAGTLWFFWVGAGHLAEGRHFLDRALQAEAAPGVGPATGKALWVSGYIAVLQGDLPLAISLLIRCRALARVEGDPRAEAYAIHRLGCAALVGDHHVRAASLFTEALGRYTALGELNSNVVMGWIELAMTAAFSGDLDRAVELCEQARTLCDEYGERWARSYAMYVLAFAAFTHGDTDACGDAGARMPAHRPLVPRPGRRGAADGTAGPVRRERRSGRARRAAAGRGRADLEDRRRPAVRLRLLRRRAPQVQRARPRGAGRALISGGL